MLSLLLVSAGCGGPRAAEGPAPEFGGTWRFSGVVESPFAGTLSFREEREVVVTCDGATPERQPRPYDVWANREARIPACGVLLRVTLGEDGLPRGTAERTVRRPYRVERRCVETGASGQCIRWSETELFREATLRGEVTFERAGGS